MKKVGIDSLSYYVPSLYVDIEELAVKRAISAEKLIKGQGRILVRRSGTESKIRVMGESENKILVTKCVNIITKKIK